MDRGHTTAPPELGSPADLWALSGQLAAAGEYRWAALARYIADRLALEAIFSDDEAGGALCVAHGAWQVMFSSGQKAWEGSGGK